MPPPVCTTCGKWVEQGGGVCAICRTLDRLSALIRGSSIPLSAEGVLLRALRGWLAEVQDIGEICRGVVPNPSGPQLTPGGEIRGGYRATTAATSKYWGPTQSSKCSDGCDLKSPSACQNRDPRSSVAARCTCRRSTATCKARACG